MLGIDALEERDDIVSGHLGEQCVANFVTDQHIVETATHVLPHRHTQDTGFGVERSGGGRTIVHHGDVFGGEEFRESVGGEGSGHGRVRFLLGSRVVCVWDLHIGQCTTTGHPCNPYG